MTIIDNLKVKCGNEECERYNEEMLYFEYKKHMKSCLQ